MRSEWKQLLMLFAFLLGSGMEGSAGSGDSDAVSPGICIWKGTITIHREGAGRPAQPKPEKGKTVIVTGSHIWAATRIHM